MLIVLGARRAGLNAVLAKKIQIRQTNILGLKLY